MAKTLSKRIASRLSQKPGDSNRSNRMIFLALREEIHEALNDGWTVKVIWETLQEEGKIGFGYQSFNRYVKQLIKDRPAGGAKTKVEKTLASPSSTTPKKPTDEGTRGFEWNPNPRKEDLY